MSSSPRRRAGAAMPCAVVTAALLMVAPLAAAAQSPSPQPPAAPQTPTEPPPAPTPDPADDQRYFDSVTVSATLNPTPVKETPGTVSVIDDQEIARRMMENTADLVTYEPGVYIESNLTRVGLDGFNIRGIGGNRVMTQIDGVETSEQFDFGPFNVHQFALDLDSLKSAEIVRSAGSSLYGSDALGGVVSFFTKDPADYLGANAFHFGAKAMWDGRSENGSGNTVIAGGRDRLQASAFLGYNSGHEPKNKGTVETEGPTRTALNPQDRVGFEGLGKVTFGVASGNLIRGAFEAANNEVDTEAYSARVPVVAGPTVTNVNDIDSVDTMDRWRASLDQQVVDWAGLNTVSWNLYAQQSDIDQVVDEVRSSAGAGPSTTINRSGTMDYSQETFGGGLQARKAFTPGGRALLVTFGGNAKRDVFDMIRDRVDINAATGAIVPPVGVILPSKYFPKSTVDTVAGYVQGEMKAGRLTLVPGLRYDNYSMDADENDAVYLATQSPTAADFAADRLSARLGAAVALTDEVTLHGQYAGGFRAPPYSAINSGFTNLQGGYTSIPNTELRPETSDNTELGVRAAVGRVSFGVTGFWNFYDDFIQQVQGGVNPATGLLEFQYQNVSKVEIRGLEFRAEARFGDGFRLRGAYAYIKGDDVTGSEDVPLNTIAPNQGVIGLQYVPSSRWGGEFAVRGAQGQDQETAGAGFYAPAAYAVADLTGWVALVRDLTLRAGVLNLTDTKYFEWANVRGRPASDPVIDRYSSPGISALVSLAYGW
jgi:hemoglobin/transferrin/lactoferrin receptor protein